MRKISILLLIIMPLSAFSRSEKNGFIELNIGPTINSALQIVDGANPRIFIGSKLKNSQDTYLGFLALSWGQDFEINYGYSFLRNDSWVLGVETAFSWGTLGVRSDEDNFRQSLAVGGRLGPYFRLKLSKLFTTSLNIGAKTKIGLSESSSEWAFENDFLMYAGIGLRFHF